MNLIQEIQQINSQRGSLILKAFGCYDVDFFEKAAWSIDLQSQFPNGQWRTINGSHVFINNGKVVAGLEGFNGFIDDFFKEKDKVESKKEEKSENKEKRVNHPNFGDGTVVKEDEKTITVNFDKVGEKYLLKKFAHLKDIDTKEEIKESDKKEEVKKSEKKEKKIEQKEVKKDESIKILKETPKAYLLERNGVQFWVQKRWYNEQTGKLTPAGEKALNQGKERQEIKEENSKPVFNKNFKIEGQSESGKATKISAKIDNGLEEKTVSFYIPNQALMKEGDKVGIQKRMLDEKLQELSTKEGYVISKPSHTSEKGIGFSVNVDYVDIEKDVRKVMWFPKSQIKEKDGKSYIPKWLFNKKKEELYLSIEGSMGGLGYIQGGRGGTKKVEWDNFDFGEVKFVE